MPWYCLYTKPNEEPKVRDRCVKLDWEAFWPYYCEITKGGDKKRARIIPKSLFPRYLFAFICKDQLWRAGGLEGVHSVVEAPGSGPWPVPSEVVQRLQAAALPSGEVLMGKQRKRISSKYKRGDILKIKDDSSPFCGLIMRLTEIADSGIMCGELIGDSPVKVSVAGPIIAEKVETPSQ
jgi:transcription antitermination factor NusG